MWKTLTAKSKWLPGAYHLLQGERYALLLFGVCTCFLGVCTSLCVCEGENVNLYICYKFSRNSLQHLMSHTDQSSPNEADATVGAINALRKETLLSLRDMHS